MSFAEFLGRAPGAGFVQVEDGDARPVVLLAGWLGKELGIGLNPSGAADV